MHLVNKKTAAVLVLAALGFVVYSFNLNNQLFWDDDEWIKGNPYVHDFSRLKEIFTRDILSGFGLNSNYYRPLTLLSFAFNYVLHGLKPLGYHLLNNGIHIANGVLIFLLFSGVIRPQAAFLAALLFLIHPVQTEAVTYISGRGDPMSVFFMLLALWLFVKSRGPTKRFLYSPLSLTSMVLAVLSRETAILLPLLLMAFYVAFLGKGGFWRSLWGSLIKTLPYWAVSVAYGVLRLTVLNFKNTLNFYSQANEYTQHLSYRLFTFGHALIDYFRLIFVPIGLHMERDLALKTSLFQGPVFLAFLLVLLIVLIVWVLYRREKLADFRIWFFGWTWFFIGLAPVSGIIPINAVIYEHWLYLPLIGFFTVAAFWLDKALSFLRSKKLIAYNLELTAYSLLLAALVVYFSFLGAASAKRNAAWGDPEKFYLDITKYNPNTVRVWNNLGNLYSERGNLAKAIAAYKRAIENPNGLTFAQPHYNLGNIYRDQGQIDRAVEEYELAINIDPSFPFAYQNLAVIFAGSGQLEKAAAMLEKVKTLRPGEPRVYYNLGLIYLAQSKRAEAIENLTAAVELAQDSSEVKNNAQSLLDRLRK